MFYNSVKSDYMKLLWLTVLFLIPTYLQRVANSGEGDKLGVFDGISLASAGYMCNIIIILAGLFIINTKLNKNHTVILFVLFFIGLVQLYISYSIYSMSLFAMVLAFFRAVIWAFCAYIFAAKIFDKDIFLDGYMKMTTLFFLIVILSYTAYTLTGIPFGMVIGQGAERAHGLFSEPSVLGSIAPAFILISMMKRDYIKVAIGLAALVVANSTTAYTTLVLVVCAHLLYKLPRTQAAFVFLVVGAFAFFVISLDVTTSYYISDIARSISVTLDQWIGQSEFRTFTIDRLLNSIIDIPRFLSAGESDYSDEIGSLARLGGPRVMVTHMYNDGLYWTGYGLSIFAVVSLVTYRSVLDFGIMPYFISSFGIGLGLGIIFYFSWQITWWRKIDRSVFILFVSALFGTLLNSAGGLSLYILVLLGGFSALISKQKSHTAEAI
jgi:hypothetical protein